MTLYILLLRLIGYKTAWKRLDVFYVFCLKKRWL